MGRHSARPRIGAKGLVGESGLRSVGWNREWEWDNGCRLE